MKNIPINLAMIRYGLLYKTLVRYDKNNPRTIQYKKEGFDILSRKVDKLPDNIAFRPSFIKHSSCVKICDKLFIFISKSNLRKPKETKFDALFHEIGHWLHFQNLPSKEESKKVWSLVNLENIIKKVSLRASKGKDGKEFVAEVFKKLIKGEALDEDIMNIYRKLNGPKVK